MPKKLKISHARAKELLDMIGYTDEHEKSVIKYLILDEIKEMEEKENYESRMQIESDGNEPYNGDHQ